MERSAAQRTLDLPTAEPIAPGRFDDATIVAFHRDGSLPPLLCIGAWVDESESWRRLARELGPEQPLFLAGPPAEERAAGLPTNADQWAEFFLGSFGALCERRRVALAGWSYSGVIALRVAERLAARGVDVRLVALLDSEAPRRKPHGDARKRSELHHLAVALVRLCELRDRNARWLHVRRSVRDALRRARARARRLLRWRETNASAPEPETQHPALRRAIRIAYLKHEHRAVTLPVCLYWTEGSREKQGDATLGWSGVLRGELHAEPIPGGHFTVFDPPNVGALAARLARALRHAWTGVAEPGLATRERRGALLEEGGDPLAAVGGAGGAGDRAGL